MFASNGIFVWWPKVEHTNVTAHLIQFKSNETTAFSDHVVGTTRDIDEFETWNDVSGDLINIPAVTNVYPYNEDDASDTIIPTTTSAASTNATGAKKTISIIELRVSGNVSGILIPNTHEIVVRVLVPVIDDDGTELQQDMRYVEWKKVRCNNIFCIIYKLIRLSINIFLHFEHFSLSLVQIEDFSGNEAKFKIYSIGSNQITFKSKDSAITCVRICYKSNGDKICDER